MGLGSINVGENHLLLRLPEAARQVVLPTSIVAHPAQRSGYASPRLCKYLVGLAAGQEIIVRRSQKHHVKRQIHDGGSDKRHQDAEQSLPR